VSSDDRAPVVSNDCGACLAKGMDQSHDVGREVQDVISLDVVGRIRQSIAPLIGGNDAPAGVRNWSYLMPPGEPGLGESVTEDHKRPLPSLGDMHPDAVGLDESVLSGAHVSWILANLRRYLYSITVALLLFAASWNATERAAPSGARVVENAVPGEKPALPTAAQPVPLNSITVALLLCAAS